MPPLEAPLCALELASISGSGAGVGSGVGSGSGAGLFFPAKLTDGFFLARGFFLAADFTAGVFFFFCAIDRLPNQFDNTEGCPGICAGLICLSLFKTCGRPVREQKKQFYLACLFLRGGTGPPFLQSGRRSVAKSHQVRKAVWLSSQRPKS